MTDLLQTTMVDKYDYQMGVVLGILGSPCDVISDETVVGDFVDSGDSDLDIARLVELEEIFRIKVGLQTPLWELAKAICFEELGETNGNEESERSDS